MERMKYRAQGRTTEVKAAIRLAKAGKAPGPTIVVAEMLKAAGDEGVQWMTDLCNPIISKGKIPKDWKKSWMVRVYKGKGDALNCRSYRGSYWTKWRDRVQIDSMQFGFSPEKAPQMQYS